MRLQSYKLETAEIKAGRQYWRMLATVWLRITLLRSQLVFQRGAQEVAATHRVRMRFDGQVEVGMRFRKGAQLLHIQMIEEIGLRQKWQICLCSQSRPAEPAIAQDTQ